MGFFLSVMAPFAATLDASNMTTFGARRWICCWAVLTGLTVQPHSRRRGNLVQASFFLTAQNLCWPRRCANLRMPLLYADQYSLHQHKSLRSITFTPDGADATLSQRLLWQRRLDPRRSVGLMVNLAHASTVPIDNYRPDLTHSL